MRATDEPHLARWLGLADDADTGPGAVTGLGSGAAAGLPPSTWRALSVAARRHGVEADEGPLRAAWERGEPLGSGAQGEVRAATWRGANVAIKRIDVIDRLGALSLAREVHASLTVVGGHLDLLPLLGFAVIVEGERVAAWTATPRLAGGPLSLWLDAAAPGFLAAANAARKVPDAARPALALFVASGPAGLAQRLRVAASVGRALAWLHTSGNDGGCGGGPVVHRDVKPSNILMDGWGRARLGDLGLARRIDTSVSSGAVDPSAPLSSATNATTTAETGTPLWMSPEAAGVAGASGPSVGPASDVWSLGLVTASCASALPPYHGSFLTPEQATRAVANGQLRPSAPGEAPGCPAAGVRAGSPGLARAAATCRACWGEADQAGGLAKGCLGRGLRFALFTTGATTCPLLYPRRQRPPAAWVAEQLDRAADELELEARTATSDPGLLGLLGGWTAGWTGGGTKGGDATVPGWGGPEN